MNEELKKKIDSVWLESDFGKWCEAVAKNEVQKANTISKQIFDSGYLMMETLEDELADKLAEVISSEAEIDEYLHLLEKENSDLVGVIIRQELFYKVSKRMYGTEKNI